jgi:hypothetical protein
VPSAAQTVASTEQRTALDALERAVSAASTANSVANLELPVFHAAAAGPRLNVTDAHASIFKLTAAAWWPPPHSHAMRRFLLLLQFVVSLSSPSADAVFL